ncbi:MAG: LCP family protein, partial [Clostridia bacterium]|nr:LCP family protein [Clostridia bacterium]
MENGNKKKKKGLSKGGLIAIIIVAVILICSVLLGVIYINKLKNAPEDLFNTITEPAPSKEPEPIVNDDKESNRPKPSPTLSDFEKLQQNADTSIMQNIVNVLLIGVDYAEERTSANPNWTGKTSYHADVMIILAINFDENTVDMISVPRDTMIQSMPGVGGIYKMNASLDCGGGFPDGFEKVMEANEWMIGGIPIDYYYAVTMHGCKDLVDAIGGVYYDLDIDFTLAGREYKAGYQYMDGQAVLDYLRVRKNEGKSSLSGKTGDLNRINRQKDMLVAIFNKLKSKKMLTKLPEILDAFEGQFYTNVNFSQTAALALFGMGLDSKDISMHSMSGKMRSVYNWSFCLTDQQKRVKLIKEVY